MGKTVIEINPLNPFSILQAAKRLKLAQEDFEKKVDEFISRLAEIGQLAAQAAYAGTPIDVSVIKTDDAVILQAHGEAVVFMEFGAGSRTDSGNRLASKMPFEVRRGSFSDSKNPPGPYAQSGYRSWEFGGQIFYYIEPRNGMEKAYEAMIRDVKTVAKAVFG